MLCRASAGFSEVARLYPSVSRLRGIPSISRVYIVQRMQVGQHSACQADIDMGVDLGRAQIGMAEHFLDGPQIRPFASRWVAKACLSLCGEIRSGWGRPGARAASLISSSAAGG